MKRFSTKEIMDVIDAQGDVTRKTLADKLNTNMQTVRYHLRALMKRGDIQVVRTTPTHADELKWYGRPRITLPIACDGDRFAERIRAAAELELCAVLDQWARWTAERLPNGLMADTDRRIHTLDFHEQAALAKEHGAVLVWSFARIDQQSAYRSAINRLLEP